MDKIMEIKRIIAGQTNCYLIGSQEALILVDCGSSNLALRTIDRIERLGISPNQIKLLLITHAHLDHYGAASTIQAWCHAPVATHFLSPEYSKIKKQVIPPAGTLRASIARWIYLLLYQFRELPPIKPDILLDDGDSLTEYGIEGKLISTPGHSPDSISFVTNDGYAFVGDLYVNYSIPSQPLFQHDPVSWKSSSERIKEINPRMIYVGHGEPFSGSMLNHIYPARYQFYWWVR